MDLFSIARRDPTDLATLHVLHDAWSETGDPRSEPLRQFIDHLERKPNWRRKAPNAEWAWELGLPLAQAALDAKDERPLADILRASRLALEISLGGKATQRTHFFGDPELPADLPWPTHADCTMWDDAAGVSPDLPCRFVCQIDLGTLPGDFPLDGLLSLFTFAEFEEIGTLGFVLHHFPPTTELVRRAHPEADEENCRLQPIGVRIRTVRTLPDDDDVRLDLEKHGLFGHLRGTTGADPSPTPQHHRLLVLPCDDIQCVSIHLAIAPDALERGDLSAAELVWVDFDG